MAGKPNDLLEILLRECAARAPEPWYPSVYATATGVARDALDADLDRLRLGGLVRLTDWVQGKGQGYTLTPEGAELLQNPRSLQRLRANGVEIKPVAPPLRPAETRPTTWNRGEAVREALLNPTRPRVTFLLIGLNIMVFFAGMYLASRQDLTQEYLNGDGRASERVLGPMGALNRGMAVVAGQWWRLLAWAFLHRGLLHVCLNMYFLYSVGPIVETLWGSWRYLILYLGSALGAGTGVILADSGAVGASGALCGLLASMGTWVLLNRPYLPPDLTSRWLRNLAINVFLIVIISMFPGVSAIGHFAGGLAGALLGIPLIYSRYGHGSQRWLALAGIVAIPLACLGSIFWSVTDEDKDRALLFRTKIAVAEAREAVRGAFNNLAVPLLNKDTDSLFDDPEIVREAISAFETAQKDLKRIGASLDGLTSAAEPVRQELENAKDLITNWSRFFETFQQVLERRIPWTEEKRRDLLDMGNALVKRSNRL